MSLGGWDKVDSNSKATSEGLINRVDSIILMVWELILKGSILDSGLKRLQGSDVIAS